MIEKKGSQSGIRLFIIAASFVVIIFGINQAQSVIALLLFSIFLALIATPPVLWMERKGVPSFAAVLIIMAGMVSIIILIGVVVGESLAMFSDELPLYQKRLQEEVLKLKPFLLSKHIVVTNKVLLEYINPGPVMGLVVGFIAKLGSALSDMLLILLTVTFILLEASSFPIKLRSVLGDPKRAFPHFTLFVGDVVRYVVIKTLVSLATGILIGIWLYSIGVDYPVLWGFLAFLLNYIPSVGSTIAAIPAVLLALIQLGVGSALLATAGFMSVNFILDNLIETKLMGRRLGLSTLVVFLSLMFWGSVLGPVGMVLCIPLTMSLKFACENNKETEWIAHLLGPEDPGTMHSASTKRRKSAPANESADRV